MPPSQRITIRVPLDLLTTLESHLRPGEALSDIVRQELQDYVRRMSDAGSARTSDGPSDTTPPGDILTWMREMTQRLEELSDAVRHLAAPQPLPRTPGRKPQPRVTRSIELDAAIPPYDTTKYLLGRLCPRGHEYAQTGKTLLRMPGFHCRQCEAQLAKERRAAQRESHPWS